MPVARVRSRGNLPWAPGVTRPPMLFNPIHPNKVHSGLALPVAKGHGLVATANSYTGSKAGDASFRSRIALVVVANLGIAHSFRRDTSAMEAKNLLEIPLAKSKNRYISASTLITDMPLGGIESWHPHLLIPPRFEMACFM